ncbi:hypothetical protein [Paenibacillus agricola]|uniref:Spo0E like sporulation regulatory protein n=1 Tax=Paenibacillus agricola TaxID=2716264 RepID=A0ABX0JHF4_9BACL|nr:hypothetical protein [Paenibacillus agricola]NHN34347.1 hypothetical protein [Paenibacillus agricola]
MERSKLMNKSNVFSLQMRRALRYLLKVASNEQLQMLQKILQHCMAKRNLEQTRKLRIYGK